MNIVKPGTTYVKRESLGTLQLHIVKVESVDKYEVTFSYGKELERRIEKMVRGAFVRLFRKAH